MKLSLAWIFDHIKDLAWQSLDINAFVEHFNNTTAEIDSCTKVSFDLASCGLAYVTQHKDNQAVLYCSEWKSTIMLPLRKDAPVGSLCLIKKDNELYRYATLRDFHADKEGLMPPWSCPSDQVDGTWKATCLEEDYLILIDNRSLTHRPDLWSHRGIAREVTALLNACLVPEEELIAQRLIKNYDRKATLASQTQLTLEINDPSMCDRFAGLFINRINNKHSVPFVAQCLTSVNARPINALVDATNYVMYDIGQPMHAFEAKSLTSGTLSITTTPGKQLILLDGQEITLTPTDAVVAHDGQPLALAGIMGGAFAAVSLDSQQIFIESAHFDPTTIRKSSLAHKKRTESSARFEKGLDPNHNTTALMRFLRLISDWGIDYIASDSITSLGDPACPRTIILHHEFVERVLGITIAPEDIIRILSKLEFGVSSGETPGLYAVIVPTFRLRDITIQNDLVEEIGRYIGYQQLKPAVALRAQYPVNNQYVMRVKQLKRHCAFALGMHEIAGYPFFDEEFLRTIGFNPEGTVEVANPVSEQWRRLVTSLVPHLLKALTSNTGSHQAMRFFEWSKIWRQHAESIEEKFSLSCCWYEPNELDFFAMKAALTSLFDSIGADVSWRKATTQPERWYHPHQTALLYHENTLIGSAGIANPLFLRPLMPGSAFIVEIDGNFLRTYSKPPVHFRPLPKYPGTTQDMSVLAPFTITFAQIEQAIIASDHRISEVSLIDSFEKPEWKNERSMTLRYKVSDETKTLTKEEIDAVTRSVHASVAQLGVTIR